MLILSSGVERSVGGRSVQAVDGLLKGLVCSQPDEAVMVWYPWSNESDIGRLDYFGEHGGVRLN